MLCYVTNPKSFYYAFSVSSVSDMTTFCNFCSVMGYNLLLCYLIDAVFVFWLQKEKFFFWSAVMLLRSQLQWGAKVCTLWAAWKLYTSLPRHHKSTWADDRLSQPLADNKGKAAIVLDSGVSNENGSQPGCTISASLITQLWRVMDSLVGGRAVCMFQLLSDPFLFGSVSITHPLETSALLCCVGRSTTLIEPHFQPIKYDIIEDVSSTVIISNWRICRCTLMAALGKQLGN